MNFILLLKIIYFLILFLYIYINNIKFTKYLIFIFLLYNLINYYQFLFNYLLFIKI